VTGDLRVACRTLARSPAFTLTSVAVLAMGIGANTAIYGLINQVLLNPPGISHPERVIAVRAKYDKLGLASIPVSVPDFADVQSSKATFEYAAVMGQGGFNYTGGSVPERLRGASVSLHWFDVFGAKPLLGRTFRPEEDQPNANAVAVLSYACFVRVFGADSTVVGRTIPLNQKPYQVIGVMSADFRWPRQVDVWAPLALPPGEFSPDNRFNEGLLAVARLKPGVSAPQADALVGVLAGRVRNGSGDDGRYARDSGWGMFTVPMTDFIAGETRTPMLVLLGAVGFVLLIACSNIAGLMLARTASRAREIAVRAALGGRGVQLFRQTIAESLLLATVGALLGVALAWAGMRLLLSIAPPDAVVGLDVRVDLRVLLFTALAAILSGIMFAIAPSWQASRMVPHEQLKGGGRSTTGGRGRQRLRAALVVGETGLALVLLVGAGLLLRSVGRLQDVYPGFEPRGVTTATLSLPEGQYDTAEKQVAFYRALTDRLATVPGVTTAAAGAPLPFSGNGASASFTIEGRPSGPGDPGPHGNVRAVTPGYFKALGIPLKSGRLFVPQDRSDTQPVVIIDENLARQYWPDENPVGKHMRRGSNAPWSTIVGIVGHVRHSDLASDTSKGTYYYSLFQVPIPWTSIVVKAQRDPSSLAAPIRDAVLAVDPTQALRDVTSMEELVSGSLAPRRFVARLLAFFAAVAVFMAALGLYGIITYSVMQRTQEIGLRMALGAQAGSVVRMVVGQGLLLSGAGVAVGLIASMICSRLLASQLFQVSPFDPATFASMVTALLAATLLAAYIPARRAIGIDPLEALRCE